MTPAPVVIAALIGVAILLCTLVVVVGWAWLLKTYARRVAGVEQAGLGNSLLVIILGIFVGALVNGAVALVVCRSLDDYWRYSLSWGGLLVGPALSWLANTFAARLVWQDDWSTSSLGTSILPIIGLLFQTLSVLLVRMSGGLS